ncbi:MAG: rhodanese-like domain-containing protein [Burkholderiaceae bacterium]
MLVSTTLAHPLRAWQTTALAGSPVGLVRRALYRTGVGLMAMLLSFPAAAQAGDAAIEAMNDYMVFANYEAGILLVEQIDDTVRGQALFVDARDAGQFAAGTIPGAINIEWRRVLERIDEIPSDRMTILFCNTGTLSAQAVFALRVAGRSNVVVLQGGYRGWLEHTRAQGERK